MRYSPIAGMLMLCVLCGSAAAQQRIQVAGGAIPVMIDGQIEEREWSDGKEITIADSIRLYVKQADGQAYLAIRMGSPTPRPVDLFLIPASGPLHQLHASMATGERLLPEVPWSDESPAWRWHRHADWTANDAELDPEKPFEGDEWRIRIEVGHFPGSTGSFVFPTESKREVTATWALLELAQR